MQTVKHGDIIVKEALEWVDTPYKDRHRTKGHSVDCAGLIYMIGLNVGADVKDLDVYCPEPTDSSLTDVLNDRLVRIPEMQIGCVLSLKIFKFPQHLAMVVSPTQIIHANMSSHKPLNKVIKQRISPKLRINGYYTYKWQS